MDEVMKAFGGVQITLIGIFLGVSYGENAAEIFAIGVLLMIIGTVIVAASVLDSSQITS